MLQHIVASMIVMLMSNTDQTAAPSQDAVWNPPHGLRTVKSGSRMLLAFFALILLAAFAGPGRAFVPLPVLTVDLLSGSAPSRGLVR